MGEINLPKISWIQLATLFICFLMNLLDGMDIMVISYAAPSLARELNLDPKNLGYVFSSGLLGMTLGALFLTTLADKLGRKFLIMVSAILMGIFVFATVWVHSFPELILMRFFSGIGIGSMLATTATMSSEYAPKESKTFWVSFVMSGYPVGAILTGLIAAPLIHLHGWQYIFLFAGCTTLVALPLIYFFLAESLEFLLKSRPKNALIKANILLQRMGKERLYQLPEPEAKEPPINLIGVLNTKGTVPTLLLWLSFFLSFACLYFLTSWIPRLASISGMNSEWSIYSGTLFNLGAFFGILSLGYLSKYLGLKKSIFFFLVGNAALMLVFGLSRNPAWIMTLFGLIGFSIQGGFVGLYSVASRMYPTQIRATGMGWAVGAGRIGAILGPIFGGLLIDSGLSMQYNFIIFAIPTLLAGISTLFIQSIHLNS